MEGASFRKLTNSAAEFQPLNPNSSANWIPTGAVETMPRSDVGAATTGLNASGRIAFTFFYATRDLLAATVNLIVGSTPAAATPTLIRFGIYTVAADEQLDLAASTPNDTTLLATGSVLATKALSTPYQLVKGTKYAFAVIVVSGATLPTFNGNNQGSNNLNFVDPMMMAARAGQSDLLASITKATLTGGAVNSASRIHAWFTP